VARSQQYQCLAEKLAFQLRPLQRLESDTAEYLAGGH
jgi:hypothetical protein